MTRKTKLLVTRPEPDASRTAAHLKALGLDPVVAPLLDPVAQDVSLPDPHAYAAIAFTSPNAVRFFARRCPDGAVTQKPVFAVGDGTAEAARNAGFLSVRAAEGTLADLVPLIIATHEGGAILHPAGRDLSGDMAGALAAHGIKVLGATLYAMEQARALPPAIRAQLVAGEIEEALFFSRRTAEAFARLAAGPDLAATRARLGCLCISANCAEPLVESHFPRIALADQPSHEAMMALALAFTRDQKRA